MNATMNMQSWVILLKPGHYCDIEVENLKFDIFFLSLFQMKYMH